MISLRRFSVMLMGLAFLMTLAAATGYGQRYGERGRHWRGDSCRDDHYDRSDRGRRGRSATYRSSPRYYTNYYPQTYGYPRYVRTYPRYSNYPRYYNNNNYYTSYPRYRSYGSYPRRRSGVSVTFGFGR